MSGSIDLPMLIKLFSTLYFQLDGEGYFQQDLGFYCVDAGFIPGTLGHDIEGVLLLELRKTNLAPIGRQLDKYSEDDLFDIIEFLYDHCSKPVERSYHSYSDCGWHCSTFDRAAGHAEYREKINRILAIYQEGYELSADGEILSLPESGLAGLMEAPVPTTDPQNIEARVEAARLKFRRHRSSLDDRRDAIRDLADVLEYLRPKLKGVLKDKDESDLFNLANNFGIRHHNEAQKIQYDKPIWYSWLFYYYLATIHAVVRLIAKADQQAKSGA